MIYFSIASILILSFLLSWKSLFFVGFLVGILSQRWQQAAWRGFFSAFLVWALLSYYFDLRAMGSISQRMAPFFHLPNPHLLFLLVGFLGGVLTMSCAMAGYYFSQSFPRFFKTIVS